MQEILQDAAATGAKGGPVTRAGQNIQDPKLSYYFGKQCCQEQLLTPFAVLILPGTEDI